MPIMVLISGRNSLSYRVIFDHHGMTKARRARAMRLYRSFVRSGEGSKGGRGAEGLREGKRMRLESESFVVVAVVEAIERGWSVEVMALICIRG